MDYSTLLNSAQLDAVTTSSQFVRIVAGAGSGKTRVLTYRISYLISEMHVDPRRILAIAFTNKVAAEMKQRVIKLLDDENTKVRVMTFHSFCAYFLRAESHRIGYPTNYMILDEDDQAQMVKDIATLFGYKKSDKIVKSSLDFIRIQKAKGVYPDDVKLKYWTEEERENLRFYKEYENKKQKMFALDFDDLLLQTINILQSFEDVRDYWSRRYDHLLVDEFQDVNDIQYKLLNYLTKVDSCVYVVGDPDQTIYTWRGANQKIIMSFNEAHPGAETIILDRNYRSTEKILSVANKLISKNKNRVPKDLFTEEQGGDDVVTKKYGSDVDEANYVCSEVNKICKTFDGKFDYTNTAILYRSAYLTRPFEAELMRRGIPYKIYGGLRFYQRREVKDVMAYFRLILNPEDDVSFQRIINIPKRGIGEASVDQMIAEASRARMSLFEYTSNLPDDSELSSRVRNALTIFHSKIEEVKQKLKEDLEVYPAILKDFITDIGYYEYLTEEQEPDEDRQKNVDALFDDMIHFLSSNDNATFDEFLQNVTLLTSQDDIKDGNFLTLMTIHIAKGLEFDNVFVIGLEDSAFPNPRSLLENPHDGIEEERRLAYVAMTRARKKLYLTCNIGYSFVSNSRALPSVFFTDAGLPFPAENNYNPWDKQSYPGWRNVRPDNQSKDKSFFGDGNHLSPFDDSNEVEEEIEKPKTNGINDWKVGDRLRHEVFGSGEVVALIGNNVIVVEFESQGKKTLIGDHPKIKRLSSKGGEA